MDYGLAGDEQRVVREVHDLAHGRGGPGHVAGSATSSVFDPALDADLAATGRGSPFHHRLLLVETAAELGLPALPGPRVLVAPEILGSSSTGPVCVVDRGRPGPVRMVPDGGHVLGIDGDAAWTAEVGPSALTPIVSSFGYPYAELGPVRTTPLPAGSASRLRALWHVSAAGEVAGTARGALQRIVAYLDERQQFGRRLASLQALRHRVAELAVSTEAVTWLVREAAWHRDGQHAATAALYARDLAAKMAPELVQLSGARGFALEAPIHLFAMRLEGLRLELGSADRLGREAWESVATGAVA